MNYALPIPRTGLMDYSKPTNGDVTNGLVLWLKLNEGSGTVANDSSGKGNTGGVVGSPSWSSPNGVILSGSNYIGVSGSNSINMTGSFSISCWASAPALSGEQRLISHWGTNPSNQQFLFEFNNTNVLFAIFTTTAAYNILTSATSLSTNTLYHLVGTYDGTTMRAYINSVIDVNTHTSNTAASCTGSLGIGIEGESYSGDPLTGKITDIRIYNRTLSSTEITTLYGLGPL
jgi:hypothetical protein